MIGYIVVAVISILLGGYGGYRWGAAAEKKASGIIGVAAKKL